MNISNDIDNNTDISVAFSNDNNSSIVINNNPFLNKDNNVELYSADVFNIDNQYLPELHTVNTTILSLYKVKEQNQEFNVMSDSSASENYVSPKLIPYTESIRSIKNRCIEIANDTVNIIDKVVKLKLNIYEYSSEIEENIFDSKFDIILGRTRLQKEKPIPNWTMDEWTINKNNTNYIMTST